MKNLLEYIGLEPGRLHFSWISSAEAEEIPAHLQRGDRSCKEIGARQQADKRHSESCLMDNAQVAQNIRDIAKRLLSEGVVDCVIGFEKGTVPMRDRPFFAYTRKMPKN